MTALPRALLAAALLAAPTLARGEEALASQLPEASEVGAGGTAAEALPAITVVEVRPRQLIDRVIASGLMDAVEEVTVQPLVEGQPIDELLADVGDTVEKGGAGAPVHLHAGIAAQPARRQPRQRGRRPRRRSGRPPPTPRRPSGRPRDRELAQAGTVPRAQADQSQAAATASRAQVGVAEQGAAAARAQLALVEAQIENAELQLSRAEVKAPVAGLVVARNAQVGAIASAAGAPMFRIVRDGAMELRADLAEQDLLRLEPGQAALLVSMEGAEPVAGRVRLVEPAIDPQTRLGTARIEIEEPGRVVKGMFLTAEVIVEEARRLAIPVTAVGSGPEGSTVMRVRDGVVERVDVTTGIRDGGLIGIEGGLEEGDLVVAKAAAFVRDGDRINPVRENVDLASAAAPRGE